MSEKMNVEQRPSDHFDERRDAVPPSFLILHYTDTQNLKEAEDFFLGRVTHPEGGRVSVHYMIDFDGRIYQYVDEEKRAWHAGVSHWGGLDDLNSHSIGIELVNPGRKYGYRAFPVQQMAALVSLCKDILQRHNISPFRVLGHSDIAPDRKKDPGELFDWKMLAQAGIGVFPKPEEEDRKIASDYVRDESLLKEAFAKAGYQTDIDLTELIATFQRHYYPEAFNMIDQRGVMNEAAAARLHWLVRHRPER